MLNRATPLLNPAITVLVIAMAGCILFMLQPGTRLIDSPLTEDGYYSLSVARNLAMGKGLTIDGTQWTNGFQPLWVFLTAPIYLLYGADRIEPLRLVLLLATLIWLATSHVLGKIAADFKPATNAEARRRAYWV